VALVVRSHRLSEEIERAKSEALKSFGSDQLLIEKYFEAIRHVEVRPLLCYDSISAKMFSSLT
jgi:3-methylcrotonyl-CoA carboxylase alpha subunit